MPIRYVLRDNKVTSDPNDYYAVAVPTSSAELDDVADRMLQQGSTVSKVDILAVLESMTSAIESMLLDGMRVNVGGLASFFGRVNGKFDGAGDQFDPARHTLNVGVTTGARIRDTIRSQGTTQKETAALPQPILLEYEDFVSNTTNTVATSDGLAELKGDNLQFDPAQADEGIFFIDQATQSEIQVTTVGQNFPKTLMFQNPSLSPATPYALEVRARISAGGPLRTGTLGVVLSVP